jgi:polar amino acid transport system substrate-binding protein
MRAPKFVAQIALLALLFVVGAQAARAVDADVQRVLAPTGKLRAGLYPGTPTSILPNPGGEPRGVGFELGRELAKRLGVPYEPVVFPRNAEVLAALKAGSVDVIFTNASAARAREMDFAPPYLDIELGYLVPKGSPVTALTDVDRPGRRVGVTEGSTSDATLSRDLRSAEIVRAVTLDVAVEMMSAGRLDAFATNKATLFEMAERLPGAQVLEGRWGLERHAIAIAKGRDVGLPFLQTFTDDMRAEGFVAAAVARAGLRGAMVAERK